MDGDPRRLTPQGQERVANAYYAWLKCQLELQDWDAEEEEEDDEEK